MSGVEFEESETGKFSYWVHLKNWIADYLKPTDLDIDGNKYLSVNVKDLPPDSIYDYISEKYSLCVTRGGGKASFIEEYTSDQLDLIIITGEAGYVLQVVGVYTATDSTTGEMKVDFVGDTQKLWRLYAAKYQSASEDDFIKQGAPGESVKLNTTTGAVAAFIIANYRKLLAVEADYNNLTVADFQEKAATGTATNPYNINDNDVGTYAQFNAVDQYVEVAFSKPFRFNQFRYHGNANHAEDGTWKIQYFDLTTGAWTDLITGIPTRLGSWSGWTGFASKVTTKIRIVATHIDENYDISWAAEWEMKYGV